MSFTFPVALFSEAPMIRLFSLALILLCLPVHAQKPNKPGQKPQKNAAAQSRTTLPSDQRLLKLHVDFVREAERLAKEYEHDKEFDKAITVYQEILKLTPEYRGAKERLDELRLREKNANVRVFQVDATDAWQDSGIKVIAGKPVSIRATGTWTFTLKATLGPDGMKIPKELKDFNLGCLVGIIKTSARNNDDTPFVVGAETSFVARETGRLYLRMYDIDPADNRGSLKVEIRGTFDTP